MKTTSDFTVFLETIAETSKNANTLLLECADLLVKKDGQIIQMQAKFDEINSCELQTAINMCNRDSDVYDLLRSIQQQARDGYTIGVCK